MSVAKPITPEISAEIAFRGLRVRRKVASALLLACALPLLVLAYALHLLSAPALAPGWWLIGGMTLPALLAFTALLVAGAAFVIWELSTAVSNLASLVASGQITATTVADRSDEIGTLVTSFASMTATIDRQAHEINEIPERLDQLTRLAFQDPLTGLPNRKLFLDRMGQGAARAKRQRKSVAVLFLDLDRFKRFNDGLGHSTGDQLLAEVGQRLNSCIREEETLARLGGDEFGIFLEDVTDLSAVTVVAERVAASLRQPFTVRGRDLVITASIGIAMSGAVPLHPDQLLRQADVAMYHAKREGGARYHVFRGSMEGPALKRLDVEIDLRRAVESGELTLHYQPIVALASGRVTGVEALLRWEHSRFGALLPAEIIHTLEETELIGRVGQWILREACRQVVDWQGKGVRGTIVSVNLCPRHLEASCLVDDVRSALREAGLKPSRLKLEITESAAMADVPGLAGRLQALRGMGVRLAIDDFGTGYSSMTRLKHFPVESLKIDRTLVRDLPRDRVNLSIVRALVQLARGLNLTLTAEGVESYEQVAQLSALGCDEAQGYYFAPALPPNRVRAFLMSRGVGSVADQARSPGR
jgi:diguanylate cyclase (GGDEF)-like protein